MRDGLNIQQVERLKPDLMGFIFYDASKRFVGSDFDKRLLPLPSHGIRNVAVFVNESRDVVEKIIDLYGFTAIQLHGSESPEYCESFRVAGITVFKAFGIHPGFNWETLVPYVDVCDYFLFDTRTKGHGGSGEKFDWQMLHSYTLHRPFLLSGGIGVDDVRALRSLNHPNLKGVDLNSRFELIPGMKDVKLLEEFIIRFKQ